MKVCTYQIKSSIGFINRLGILLDNSSVLDPNLVWTANYEREGCYNPKERALHKMPTSLFELLNTHDNPINCLKESLDLHQYLKGEGIDKTLEGGSLVQKLDGSKVSLKAPLDKIHTYRDFYSHEKHVKVGFEKRNEKIPDAWYEIPAYYKGATAGFIGPDEVILWPSYSNKLDYELELAIIIGRGGKNIDVLDAPSHIFGFTILNDISARDIQKKEMSIRLGPAKGKDFCSVIGPVITTFDEFNFREPNLKMTAKVNGQEWSNGQSGDAKYSFAEMITHASKDEWICPGDLFGSGTVGTGCGLELDKWIQPNDVIELEIESIGILKNKVGKK